MCLVVPASIPALVLPRGESKVIGDLFIVASVSVPVWLLLVPPSISPSPPSIGGDL